MIKVDKPIVSVDWLHQNIDAENLIILDATIPKVGTKNEVKINKKVIPNTRFFDIKNTFSDKESQYPNTILSAKNFEEEAQNLGINKNTCIVAYDDLGVYASPRAWWMFKLMGFDNIAVLDGGFPAWEKANFNTEKPKKNQFTKGNFIADYQSEKIKVTEQVLSATKNNTILIADARSKGRFYGTEPEPRKEIRGGHMPNSVSLPYGEILSNGRLKSTEELKRIFEEINPTSSSLIFSCGSGITACVLALGAEIANIKNYAVYDGSWTEWGSRTELPIIK
ncbi:MULTISPECIES: sulfurtransferase [Tenacibaculum]|uniref:sulfurtransferase n=1 Tax=Tenacibaculum TaxID=104267 RepID=UPI001F0AD493|nr:MULTISPECIES: sulfurtransferase [Tenacibaculum]MCH3882636.1 sulfurtransferase [Tenacibaculum aquimarinum]MDO6600328.1 sulfurtransferase [Tenacibaculum sp. 1_MG-2023]